MENVLFDTTNTEVQMTMVVKLHQLQRESLATLTYQNLDEYLSQGLWKKRVPRSLHTAVNDVMSVTGSDVVKFMARQAIIQGSSGNLADYVDLIGGK